ncbi:MAG: class I SAM-dependent methyltransferase, partial [Oscillospiraceae bacterium]|nr:class I SAM-dependent methyltransferase [Oscillospiraceae bacterium]
MELKQELIALGIETVQAEKMAAYGALLEEANKSFNLTRITTPAEMAEKHFYDSLAPVRLGLLKPGQN